jgi:hypothetical protein
MLQFKMKYNNESTTYYCYTNYNRYEYLYYCLLS